MSGVVNQAGSRTGVVGHMADAVMLKKTQAPASGALEVKSIFRPEYKTYEIKWHAMKMGNDNVQLQFQFSTDNGSSWVTSSNYDSQVMQVGTGTIGSPINVDGASYACVGGYGNQGAASNEGASGSIFICDPMNPTARKNGYNQWVIWRYDGKTTYAGGAFSYESSDAMNACKIYPSAGNYDSGSNYNHISIWGYR